MARYVRTFGRVSMFVLMFVFMVWIKNTEIKAADFSDAAGIEVNHSVIGNVNKGSGYEQNYYVFTVEKYSARKRKLVQCIQNQGRVWC